MLTLTRTKLVLLVVSALALGAAIALGLSYRQQVYAWVRRDKPADQSGQPGQGRAGMSMGTQRGERTVLYWYDAMNPSHHYDKPGKAPDGMDLVPKYADEEQGMAGMANMTPGTVVLNPATQQLIGVRYAEVRRARMERTVRTVGLLQMDDTKISRVHVKIAGWIEKVYLDYVGKLIKKGAAPVYAI